MPEKKDTLPVIGFSSIEEWNAWLDAQPRTSSGVWLKLGKAASRRASLSRQEAIDGALCHGWIDGQLKPYDDAHWLVRFTPRRRASKWSQVNRDRALELMGLGRMTAAGLDEVERARRDGRWDAAYAPQSKATVPPDLQAALDANPAAQRHFDHLDSRNRYAVLYRVHEAKKSETRAQRIARFVDMLSRGESIYPPK
jgi:uncharacterized protein YdeI (YjbR/CyaY-like superfamily)